MRNLLYTVTGLLIIIIAGCHSEQNQKKTPSLKTIFKNDFKVGAAINKRQLYGKEPGAIALVKKQFNAISPENVLKWERINPAPDSFNFDPADRYVRFGQENDMFILGHNLVWHHQVPEWVFQNKDGTVTDRETLLKRMRQHISMEAGRYKGKIDGWDVVNEAVSSDGTLRKSKWMQIIGKEYLPLAYEYADSAAPDAELYYNDYDLYKPAKRQGVVKLIKYLQEQGVRIDGVGIQGHWGLKVPDLQQVQKSIDAFAKLGVKVMISELDITVLSKRGDFNSKDSVDYDPYKNGLPDSVQTQLTDRYKAIFRLLHKNRDKISRVTFWGVNNGDSWLNYTPTTHTNYPLLFNRDNEPTPAFWGIKNMMSS
ncbi:MAG TPA: endo-1,4-beta-xylanase [Balneolaceae bacterium]|nr:endo-1,4-beta-xylanase [Balneolaceae bacterium]